MRPTIRPDAPRPVQPRPDDPRRDGEPLNPKLTDKQKLEQLRKISANYPKWDAAKYDRAISGTFDAAIKGNDEYFAVINAGAIQNRPVVMLIGSGSDPATRHVIENSLKDARSKNGREAIYAFVDLDKVDPNSQIGRYASENMAKKGQEPPFTMVFGMSRSGDKTNPVKAEAPAYYSMGAPDTRGINEGISRAKLNMVGQFTALRDQINKQNPKPDQVAPKPEQPGTRGGVPDTSSIDKRIQEAIAMSLVQAQRQTDKEKAYAFLKQAVDLADGTKNPLLQAATRTEMGISCLKWGFKETGYKWIMEGAAKNPSFYNDQQNQDFKARLADAGVPPSAVNYMMENGKRDPNWYTKDKDAGKKVEAAEIAKPIQPGYPSGFDKPVFPVQPSLPPGFEKPALPAQPALPSGFDKPVLPVKPAVPSGFDKPVLPGYPSGFDKPVFPVQPTIEPKPALPKTVIEPSVVVAPIPRIDLKPQPNGTTAKPSPFRR